MVDDGVRFASVLGGELLHVLVDLRGQPAKVIHAQACPRFSSAMRSFIGRLRSGGCKRQVADRLGCRPHLDFDVVAEAVQAVHQLALIGGSATAVPAAAAASSLSPSGGER